MARYIWIGIYLLAIFGGWAFVGLCLFTMRAMIGHPGKRSFRMLDFFLGGMERAIAITLVIWAPSYLSSFIGAWIAFKFAANWQRIPLQVNEKTNADGLKVVTEGSLLFLIGSAISFTIAILAGVFLNPHALEIWAAAK